MARQLRSQGEEVGPVLLFDSFVANNPNVRDLEICLQSSLRHRVAFHWSRASRLGLTKGLGYVFYRIRNNIMSEIIHVIRRTAQMSRAVLSKLKEKTKRITTTEAKVSLEVKQCRVMEKFIGKTFWLLSRYRPGVYEGRIILFKAAQADYDAELFWTGLAQGGMIVHKLPGVHMEMMEEPEVINTSLLVRECLDHGKVSTKGRLRGRNFCLSTDKSAQRLLKHAQSQS
jgi:thioesterase domain-containing protein